MMICWDACLAGGPEWLEAVRALAGDARIFAQETAEDGLYAAWDALAAQGGAEWLFFCRPGALPQPDAAQQLARAAECAPENVCAVEMRTLPLENPKFYHPLTLETTVLDGTCFAVRRASFAAAGGFEKDGVKGLSRRLRKAGGSIRVAPRAAAVTQASPPECEGFKRVNAPLTVPPAKVHFTVLIRAWKRPDALERALACLEHQTYRDFDVVVAEDGAQPVCAEAVARHQDSLKLTYLPLGRDAGRSAAANAAMAAARGPWLVFLDDDDYFFADHLEAAARTIASAPGCRTAACASVEAAAPADCTEYQAGALSNCRTDRFSILGQCRDNAFPIQAVFFRKELFERLGGMDESLDALEDWDLWTRYFLDSPPALCPKATSLFHTPEHLSDRLDRIERMDAWKALLTEKWKTYRIDTTAADVLALVWDPDAQPAACAAARRRIALAETAAALQKSRRRQATRGLRRALCAVSGALRRIAGPPDIDVETADAAALERQCEEIRRSRIMGGRPES